MIAASDQKHDGGSRSLLREPELDLVSVKNPRAFFKKARVFETIWPEPAEASDDSTGKRKRFAVVKPMNGFSIAFPFATYEDLSTDTPGTSKDSFAAVFTVGKSPTTVDMDRLIRKPVFVKVENENASLEQWPLVNIAEPQRVGHNIKVQNVGRVFGDSVGLLEDYYTESLNHAKE